MKTILLTALVLVTATPGYGQTPPDFSSVCKEQMSKVKPLVGHWKGKATIKRGQEPAETIDQEEFIEMKLDDVVLLINGVGKKKNASTSQDETVFEAMATLNFDPVAREYKFRTFLKTGTYTDAYFKPLDNNRYEWGFEIPNGGKIKYSIELDPHQTTWNETGEYSQDGNTWYKFIEMTLNKI